MHAARALLPLLCVLLLAACGGGSDTPADEPTPPTFWTYKGTQSPGDVWTYTLGGGTFTARNETLAFDYAGTTTDLANGFLRLTVTTTTDPSVTPLPATAYAIEFPGIALLVLPADPDPQVIVCAAIGATPTVESTYNYVKLPDPAWGTGAGGIDTEEAWGVGDSHISGASGEIFDFYSDRWDMGNLTSTPTESGWSPETYTATDGWLVPDVGDQRIAVTPSGVFVQDGGPSSGGSYGVEAPASNLGTGALFVEDHDFLGFVFHYDDPDDDTQPVWAEVTAGDAWITGGTFVSGTGSFDDAVPDAGDTRLVLTTEVRPGVFRGEQYEPGTDGVLGTADDEFAGRFVMLMKEVAGRVFLFGIMDPAPGETKPINFIVLEQ